jgi:alpha-galactosidase
MNLGFPCLRNHSRRSRACRARRLPQWISLSRPKACIRETCAISLSVIAMFASQVWLVNAAGLQAAAQGDASPTAQSVQATNGQKVAETPPMGWNSWDGYGATIDEAQFRANAEWFAKHLKPYGWQYVTIDAEWFITNPVPEGNAKTSQYVMDGYGRYLPATNRFPSAANGAGFKPLADYVHSLGLRFGLHILRGLPKRAVEKRLPIAGSSYYATEAADTSDTCPWNYDNYGLNSTQPAAQAYYDSIAQLYASWGVDLVKVDCISSRPYKGDEIQMLSLALAKTGRATVLSLSPGPAPIDKVDEMRRYAEMWRISDDIWDVWHSPTDYPQGVGDQFLRAAQWAALSGPGHWPDADMLPIGHLGPAPGWGHARDTRLTHDEQRTLITLWCILRSPLMVGGDLTAGDEWTTSLLTNPEVLALDQHSTGNHQLIATNKTSVWLARTALGSGYYVALFNLETAPATYKYGWSELGLKEKEYKLRDLWEHKDLGSADSVTVTVPPHGVALYSMSAE